MKRKIILSLITICILSFASCGNSTTEEPETTVPVETTAEATPEPTVTPEPTATPNVETGTVTDEVDTSSIDSAGVDSKIDEGDYVDTTPAHSSNTSKEILESIPKDVYNPEDGLSQDEKLDHLEDAYNKGVITEEQARLAIIDMMNKENQQSSSTGTTTGGSTGSSTSGDTYIPAHGNPGTPMSNEDTGYEHANDNIDYSGDTNVTIN